ncbi:hypothetical protein KFL_001870270 [Klebsormidium nitens]|uniref:CCHC-type domain-containing protein n=1 Tax=Klebsormidium nitens TaxID=105231 RepID=A0A1Y1I0G9_KLENI|nr:hypothetical protein KFL_001870270 [Klebsormidium nitens]|eukprot:GAQ84405.1 hypothetical protein KFL_001870270 [Klebsormidium nitens]
MMASNSAGTVRERDQMHPDDQLAEAIRRSAEEQRQKMQEDYREEYERAEQERRQQLEAEAKAKADAEARLQALPDLPEAERLEAVLKENVELQGSMSQMREELNALKLQAISYLDGKAREFWDSREQLLKMSEQVNGGQEPILTMEHFKVSMIAAFGGVDPITQAWNEYENLKQGKQGKQSMEEYVRATEALVAKLGPLNGPSEMDKIQRFKAGVHSDMRTKVATRLDGSRWTSFAELVQFSVGVWQAIKQAPSPPEETGHPRTFNKKRKQGERSDDVASARSNGTKKQKAKSGGSAGGSKNGKPQHNYRQMSDEQKKKLQTEKKCFLCEKLGHFARDCPTAEKKKQEN